MVGVRVSGLASGMDIDTIVKDLMRAERMPLDKIEKEKTTLEWKRDLYREINTAIYAFYNELFDFTLQSNYQTRSVTSSNEDLVTATVASGAGTGTYTISEINQLAKAATMISSKYTDSSGKNYGISGEQKVDLTKPLYSIKDSFFASSSINPIPDADPFMWKKGGLESRTIKIEDITQNKIEFLKEEYKPKTSESIFIEDISVKVNGKGITVFSKEPDSSDLEQTVNLTENYAWLNDKGELLFKNALKQKDVVEIDYVVNEKQETRKLTKINNKWQTTLKIGGALVENNGSLTIDNKKYIFVPSGENKGNIVLADENGNPIEFPESEPIGTVNYETGLITFEPTFLDELINEENGEVEVSIKYQQHYFTFDASTNTSDGIRNENFIVSGESSLNSVFKEINNSSLGLMMFYDSFTDQVTITRTETGKFNPDGNDIVLNGGFFNKVLGFNEQSYNAGQNAVFTLNGLTTQRSSNTFSINGVSFTLKNTMEANSAQPVTLSVNNDNEKLFETIKGFVDKYNEIVEKIEEKLNEPYYKGYAPLSDLEREELTDKQQEKWEEMARSGLLRRDPILSSMITQMRSALSAVVNNNEINPQMTTLSSIGINTTADFRSAKLQLDETKLREAIEKDPESIELLFRGGGTNATNSEQGVIRRLRDILSNTRDRIRDRAGSATMTEHQYTIGRQISNFEDRIERFEQRLKQLEDRYYRQFTLMEKAIMQSNNQMMQLSQFFV